MTPSVAYADSQFVDLEQARRMAVVAMICDIPFALWGKPGIGKSETFEQIAAASNIRMYDYNLSDKEAGDLGGLPQVVDIVVDGENYAPLGVEVGKVVTKIKGPLTVKSLEYLIARGLLPFDTNETCILLFDEVDRSSAEVQNILQRIILQRKVNGHVLSPNCRIVLAGNGTTDVYTSPLSEAIRTRVVHGYAHVRSQGALDSYLAYAERTDKPVLIRAFAKFRQEVWSGGETPPIEELAVPNSRTFDMAGKIIEACEDPELEVRTDDILLPLVAGCIGKAAAMQLLEFREIMAKSPSIDDIINDPEHTEVPTEISVMFALTIALTDHATRGYDIAEAVAKYGLRWPEEPAAYLYRQLRKKYPDVITSDAYMTWNNTHLREGTVNRITSANTGYPEPDRSLVNLLIANIPGSEALPDIDDWVNVIKIPSTTPGSTTTYRISQRRTNLEWGCSCMGWVKTRDCTHTKNIARILKEEARV